MPYFNPAQPGSDVDFYLGVAADVVQRLAPTPRVTPPDTVPLEYMDRAARAERLLYNWLTQTKGGTLTGKSLSGVSSKAFANQDAVKNIVRTAMAHYYTGGGVAVPIHRPRSRRVPFFVNDPLELRGPFIYP